MYLSHSRLEWIYILYLPKCQRTPCSKQARYLKYRYLYLWILLPCDGINCVLAYVINGLLSLYQVFLVVHVITLLKPIVTQKLGKMIMIIRIKVQNHHSTFKITSTIVFRWTIISNAPKTYKYHVLLYGNLILTYKRTLNDPLYLEMLSHRAVNEILQTP